MASVETAAIPSSSYIAQISDVSTSQAASGIAPELERSLSLLSSHRSVLGYLLLSRSLPVSIIRHSGVVFEGEQGRKYAGVVGKIVESVQNGLEEINGGDSKADDVKFMRIRTKRHEIMISPDEHYLLAVLHDPSS